jgi:hypothetical protein
MIYFDTCHYLSMPRNQPMHLLYKFDRKTIGQHTIVDHTQHHL